MEIFMTKISYATSKIKLTLSIGQILHSDNYEGHSSLPLNFEVHLFRSKRGPGHSGQGTLTLPNELVGSKLLQEYGGPFPQKQLMVDGRVIHLQRSRNTPRPDVVETIRRLPYQDPTIAEERDRQAAQVGAQAVSISTIQFGWECRDNVLSVEWERTYADRTCSLVFDLERREIRIKVSETLQTLIIGIRYSQILWMACSSSSDARAIYFSLDSPPIYESDPSTFETRGLSVVAELFGLQPVKSPRNRLSSLGGDHAVVAPYTSLAIRLLCRDAADVSCFRRLCHTVRLRAPEDYTYPVEHRGRFSSSAMDSLMRWLKTLPWIVAYQIEALLRNLVMDAREILSLRPRTESILASEEVEFTAEFLRNFQIDAKALWNADESGQPNETLVQCFERSLSVFKRTYVLTPERISQAADGIYDSLHVTITPSRIILEGPFQERSNRIIRAHIDNQTSFLRVSFTDEDNLQFRFDRDVDGPSFVRERVGSFLRDGFSIAGKHFDYFAYSQSSLKEHAVIFVKPFMDRHQGLITADRIIKGIGTFDVEYDRSLIFCPARYGARISQALTATEPSITLEVEEILIIDDIENAGGCFTDGVGTISPDLARDIWAQLCQARGRRPQGGARKCPAAFQIRIMGSKGMVSIDYRLSGRVLCLRRSMIKFDASQSREIEIHTAFENPGKYRLNRPLIMLLEGLGVPYESFKKFQDVAVSEAWKAADSLTHASYIFDVYGLGASFRLTSILQNLAKLGISNLDDVFYQQMVEYGIHHILRELKHHARIPIPGGYKLVGVADIHKYLPPKHIFACIKRVDSSSSTYLEGPVLISRSPTIHPGDVQLVTAIGRPPPGSCFEREPLTNCVVFSVQGDRPLPSCLGGGDLDGDEYDLIPIKDLPSFWPKKIGKPSEYKPVPKKLLDRPCTKADVADFVVDYINSDVLGLIAINWLILADQSNDGILDADCITLAHLHSRAVDFPKNGQAVPLTEIPKLKFRAKPDWNAPETLGGPRAEFYESQRAIGKLFRAIDLPALGSIKKARRSNGQNLTDNDDLTLDNLLDRLHLEDDDSPLHIALRNHVKRYITVTIIPSQVQDEAFAAIGNLFIKYTSQLQVICTSFTLSHGKNAMLTEEEAVMGTIVVKTSQPRQRQRLIAKVREQTEHIARQITGDLGPTEGESLESSLKRAWLGYVLAQKKRTFGSWSFGLIAIGSIFDSIKAIEDRRKIRSRR